MRPRSILHAERLLIASALLILLGSALAWDALVAMGGVGLAAGSTAFLTGAFALLTLFATRRGSRIARGLLVALAVFSTASLLWQIGQGQVAAGTVGVINTVQVLLLVVAVVLLFRPNASSWFARPHDDWEDDEVDGAYGGGDGNREGKGA